MISKHYWINVGPIDKLEVFEDDPQTGFIQIKLLQDDSVYSCFRINEEQWDELVSVMPRSYRGEHAATGGRLSFPELEII